MVKKLAFQSSSADPCVASRVGFSVDPSSASSTATGYFRTPSPRLPKGGYLVYLNRMHICMHTCCRRDRLVISWQLIPQAE